MCGLTGIMSQWLSTAEIETFQELMVLASLRGRTGAGITIVPDAVKKTPELLRSTGSASEMVYSKLFSKGLERTGRPSTLMGHARLPTRGGLTLADVHPHKCGHIVGMHNGTMSVVNGSVVKREDNDSKLLFECLEKEGLETTVKRAVGEYAISWYDSKEDTVHFYRNTKRPLWFATINSGSTIWWASEAGFLDVVLGRTYGDNCDVDICELAPFHHLAFRARPNGGKVNPFVFENITPGVTTVPAVRSTTDTVEKFRYITCNGHSITQEELMAALATGCQLCGIPGSLVDYSKGRNAIVWVDRDEYVCRQCYDIDPFAVQAAKAKRTQATTH